MTEDCEQHPFCPVWQHASLHARKISDHAWTLKLFPPTQYSCKLYQIMLAISTSCDTGCQCPKRQCGWTKEARAPGTEMLSISRYVRQKQWKISLPPCLPKQGEVTSANLNTQRDEVNHVYFNPQTVNISGKDYHCIPQHPTSSTALWVQVNALFRGNQCMNIGSVLAILTLEITFQNINLFALWTAYYF